VKLHGDLLARPARQAFMPRIRWRIQGECARAAIGRTQTKRNEAKRNESETGAFASTPKSLRLVRTAKSAISRFRADSTPYATFRFAA
jgi:hypothetical protein